VTSRDDGSKHQGLAGRAVFLSGASRGIGRAIALRFAREGADLFLVATNASLLATTAEDARDLGARVETSVVDVADREQCRAAVAKAEAALGRLDSLVSCASVYHAAPFLGCAPEDYQRLLDVNLFGSIHLMQSVLPGMLDRAYGRIVVIASTAGRSASPNRSAYSVSKHALVGLTRCVAVETADKGITVNALCPGPVRTDMLEELIHRRAEIEHTSTEAVRTAMRNKVGMKRFLESDEIASLALYLASEESAAMTGQALVLDGGILFP